MTFDSGPHDEEAVRAAFAIYAAAIELSEQKTEAEFRALFGRDDYAVLLARDAGEVRGLAVAFIPASRDFWLLEYLAVDAAMQGQGLGARLASAMRERAGAARFAIVEADAASGPGIQQRRLGFYGRLGYRRLGSLAYQLPLEANGVPPPMVLLVHAAPEVAAISCETAAVWLERLYVDVYGCRADDPRLAEMLSDQPDEIPLIPPATP